MNKEKLDLFNEYIFTAQEEKGFFNNYKIKEVSNSRFYLDNSYGEAIKKYFDLTKRTSKELELINTSYGGNRYKICSCASSARFCFLYLASKLDSNIKFEWHLLNATSSDSSWEEEKENDSVLDAFDNKTYYEFKCQEIFNDKELLSISYSNLLKEYFNIEIKSNTDNKIIGTYKDLKLGNLNKNYNDSYFDIKQLLTHLLAIIKENKNKKEHITLKYIFIIPLIEDILHGDLYEDYKELEREIETIKNSELIKIAKDKYNISFECEQVQVIDSRFSLDPKEITSKMEKILKVVN